VAACGAAATRLTEGARLHSLSLVSQSLLPASLGAWTSTMPLLLAAPSTEDEDGTDGGRRRVHAMAAAPVPTLDALRAPTLTPRERLAAVRQLARRLAARAPRIARAVYEEGIRAGVDVDAGYLMAMLAVYSHHKDARGALDLLDSGFRAHDVPVSPAAYAEALRAASDAGALKALTAVMERAHADGVRLTSAGYHHAVRGFARYGSHRTSCDSVPAGRMAYLRGRLLRGRAVQVPPADGGVCGAGAHGP